jgi:LPS export ABC transporter protein LptC
MSVVKIGSVVSTFFSLMFLALLYSCENDIAKVNSVTASIQQLLPVESGKNVEIMYSDSARVRAKLTAPVLNRYAGKKAYMELPKGLEVLFFNEKRKQQTKLTANYGIGFDNGNQMSKMEVKNQVVVINEKGDKLETEHLIWDAAKKEIYTDEFVKISTKDEVIWGDGLKANQDFSEYEITNVKGQIALKDEEFNTKKDE